MEEHPDIKIKTQSTQNPLTNLDYLKQLSKGDKGFVKEMLNIFLEENPHETDALKNSIENGTFPQIYAAAHKLKSSTPFVGIFDHIKPNVLRIEELARQNEGREEMTEHCMIIDKICREAREEIMLMQSAGDLD